jgi:uncharacterized protein (DUF1778 family)
MMILSKQDSKVFVEVLLNPPDVSEKLQKSSENYKQKILNKSSPSKIA